MAAACAGVSAGFSANLIPGTPIDVIVGMNARVRHSSGPGATRCTLSGTATGGPVAGSRSGKVLLSWLRTGTDGDQVMLRPEQQPVSRQRGCGHAGFAQGQG
jgi:hypothetical protein